MGSYQQICTSPTGGLSRRSGVAPAAPSTSSATNLISSSGCRRRRRRPRRWPRGPEDDSARPGVSRLRRSASRTSSAKTAGCGRRTRPQGAPAFCERELDPQPPKRRAHSLTSTRTLWDQADLPQLGDCPVDVLRGAAARAGTIRRRAVGRADAGDLSRPRRAQGPVGRAGRCGCSCAARASRSRAARPSGLCARRACAGVVRAASDVRRRSPTAGERPVDLVDRDVTATEPNRCGCGLTYVMTCRVSSTSRLSSMSSAAASSAGRPRRQ